MAITEHQDWVDIRPTSYHEVQSYWLCTCYRVMQFVIWGCDALSVRMIQQGDTANMYS